MNSNTPKPTTVFGSTNIGSSAPNPFQISSAGGTLYSPLQPTQMKKGLLHAQNPIPKEISDAIINGQLVPAGAIKPVQQGVTKVNEVFNKTIGNSLNTAPTTATIFNNPGKSPTFPFQMKPNNTANLTSNTANTNPFQNFANQSQTKNLNSFFTKNDNPIALSNQPTNIPANNIFSQIKTDKPIQSTNNSPINNLFTNTSTKPTAPTFNQSNPFNIATNQQVPVSQPTTFNFQPNSAPNPFNNQGNNNIFQQQQQQQQPIIGINQNQQQQPFAFSNSTNLYLQHFQNFLKSQQPFQSQLQNTIPNQQIFTPNPFGQPQFNQFPQPQPQHQFNPLAQLQSNPNEPYGNYHMFLNNSVNSETLKRSATPNQLFAFAQGWANKQRQPENKQYTSQQQQAKEQIKKLFQYNVDPNQINMQMRELPPIQITLELLERMNDPLTCKIIISELWDRLKKQVEENLKSLNLPATERSQVKVRDLAFHREMGVVWKELKILQERVNQMVEKDMNLNKLRQMFCFKASQMCQNFKQSFVDLNTNNKLLDDATLQIEMVSDFLEKNVMQMFKAYQSNQPITINQPDPFIFQVSSFVLTRLNAIESNISDLLAINNHSEETVSCLEIAENMCQFYEQIAQKLYQVSEKIKKCVNLGAKSRGYGSNEELIMHIEQKAQKNIAKKLQVYNQLKQIQQILQKRGFKGCFGCQNLISNVQNVSPLSINPLQYISEPRETNQRMDRGIETDNYLLTSNPQIPAQTRNQAVGPSNSSQ